MGMGAVPGGAPADVDTSMLMGSQQGLPSPQGALPPSPFQNRLSSISNDPVLASILAGETPLTEQSYLPKPNQNVRKPSWDEIVEYKIFDKMFYKDRNERIARDINIFRQGEGGVPNLFDPEEDTQFISAAMSNVVNRLSNMMAGVAIKVDAPSWNEDSDRAAQTIENFCHWDLAQTRRQYARDGGSSRQRDEFFYLLLHGAIAARVLTDVADEKYPWHDDLLDPSTCYPTYGTSKQGMIRMIRNYTSTIGELMDAYGQYSPGLKNKLLSQVGNTTKQVGSIYNTEIEVIEYADRRWRGVCLADGTPILDLVEHGFGKTPYIYLTAIGEPKGMQDGGSEYAIRDSQFGGINVHAKKVNMAEKGVSVIHYLIHTHRLREAVYTILYQQIEKSGAPPTVRYRAPQMMGKDSPVLDWRINGTNYAVNGLEKIEALPTSPQPTDVSPTLSVLEQEQAAGLMADPGSGGFVPGGNASGYSLDVLINAAKELVLPYFQAYENYLGLRFEMKLEQFRDVVGNFYSLKVPDKPVYGRSKELTDMTVDSINLVGCDVKVTVRNNSESALMQQAQRALALQQGGLVSQKRAMDIAGEDNPQQNFDEIMTENALQHPQIMQLYGIPTALESQGAHNLANIWMEIVGKPIIQQLMMQQMMGGVPQQGGQPQQGGGQPGNPAPPQTGGQSFGPTAQGSPGGPQPGQGRGEGV
jgi:hypothetical protein